MKKIYLLVLFVFGFSAFAQQKGISYQAVIINPNAVAAPGYNGTSIPLANKAICLSFQIVNGANQIEYQESQSITTDGYGMINVVIGTGRAGAGLVSSLDAVAWNQGNKKLVVGVNTDGVCSNYTEISNQLLNYSPYSLYAQNADIKDGYVTTAKLADGAVTDSKVAMGINPTKVGLGNVNNTSDANKPVSTATQTALNLKANTTDVTTSLALKEDVSNKSNASLGSSTTLYPTQNAVKTYVDSQISSATIVDADATTKGKIKLAGDLAGTADLPTVPGLALKADTSSLSPVATSGNYNDLTNKPSIPSSFALPTATASVLGGVKVGANLSIDANGVLSASGGNNVSSLTGVLPIANGGTGTTSIAGIKSVLGFNSSKVAIGDQAGQTNQADGSVGVGGGAGANNQGGSAVAIGYVAGYNNQGASSVAIGPNAAQSGQGSSAVAIGFAAGQNGQGANSVAIGSFAGISQVANSIAINATGISTPLNPTNAGFYVAPIRNASETTSLFYNTTTKEITYGTAAPSGPLNLATGGTGILPIANGGTGASNAVSALTSLGAAPIASPTFTGTVTAPIYASTPQSLTDAATIAWDPANGLNASVTLGGARTLSFTATPTAGSYGTLVVTQDATGGRTLTLPSTATNKVLGSTSTTTIALSSAANAKDILNFYYDGTNCYWNIGQGYGTAATAATTNLATSVSGTLPVANGGTGAATLTGLVKGNGTSAMTAAIVGTDYLAPTGSAANLTNFPTLNQNTTGNAATATTATSATNVTGTVAVANGGTGAISLTTNNVLLGNGTSAIQVVAPGTSGNVLTSDGTTWTSSAPSGGSNTTYTIGLNNALGGYVVYVTPDGKHGLVAETIDQVRNTQTTASGFASREIFRLSYLATDPRNHSTAGKNFMDWRIPNYWEMQQVILYKNQIGGFDATNWPNYFLSISLNRNETDWIVSINGGDFTGMASNGSTVAVRTVRSF